MMNKTQELFDSALLAHSKAYAPYSKFAVGAAIRSANGKIFSGCNVENISYPCGSCAEQSAISAMINGGENQISEILIIADTQDPITPCGACLQRIQEFSTPQTLIHLANLKQIIKSESLNKFLPLAFSNSEVKHD